MLKLLHLDKVVTSILAGVGIAGVALGFAFQDITANLLSGIALVIHGRYPFQVHDLIKTNAFDANDITIPFPIRTLDFGIKGGKTLEQMKIQT